MLGRAIFGNPFLFSHSQECENKQDKGVLKKYLEVMLEHTRLFHELLGDVKNFAVMKKHYKAYVNGFDGAKELRMKLMETETPEDVEGIVNMFLRSRR
ncbi:MAG TPA: tRNA-dihydrouridine synthase, partial [Candidatus Paceibacterota bacterium]